MTGLKEMPLREVRHVLPDAYNSERWGGEANGYRLFIDGKRFADVAVTKEHFQYIHYTVYAPNEEEIIFRNLKAGIKGTQLASGTLEKVIVSNIFHQLISKVNNVVKDENSWPLLKRSLKYYFPHYASLEKWDEHSLTLLSVLAHGKAAKLQKINHLITRVAREVTPSLMSYAALFYGFAYMLQGISYSVLPGHKALPLEKGVFFRYSPSRGKYEYLKNVYKNIFDFVLNEYRLIYEPMKSWVPYFKEARTELQYLADMFIGAFDSSKNQAYELLLMGLKHSDYDIISMAVHGNPQLPSDVLKGIVKTTGGYRIPFSVERVLWTMEEFYHALNTPPEGII